MGDIRANPIELMRLADDTLAASRRLGDAFHDGLAELELPQSRFGDTDGGPKAADQHRSAVDAAQTSVARLVNVLEGDVDRLYRTAFAYRQADLDAAERLRIRGYN